MSNKRNLFSEIKEGFNSLEKSRIDVIGQNGNDGLHYESLCSICGKELDKVTECAWASCEKWLKETND